MDPTRLPPSSQQKIKLGDEINVVHRGRVVELGQAMVTIELFELAHHNLTDHPIMIYMPVEEIRSRAVPTPPPQLQEQAETASVVGG